MTTTSTHVASQATGGSIALNTLALTDLAGVTISDKKVSGGFNRTTITFAGYVQTIPDTGAASNQNLFTFPEALIQISSACGKLTFTTTSAIASTLNQTAGVWALGTANGNQALTTTEADIIPSTAWQSSTTINVAHASGTDTVGFLATPTNLNGSTTAKACILNLGITESNDIDADATVQIDGTVTIEWKAIKDI